MALVTLPNRVRTFMRLLVYLALACCLTAACPDSCTCKWKGGKQTVECVNKGLIALPEGMDPETQVLDISGSTLQILHRTLFQRYGLVNLQRVYLARSRLGHLDDLTFQGLTNLVELDLSDNMLTSIPVNALAELPALMRLSLARNPVRRVSAGSFRTLRYLITLELSQCQIEAVEVGAFDGLKTLEWLKLDGNSLTNIGGSSVLPRSLHGVTLHDNPWKCDCQLSQLRAWLVQFNIPLSMEPKCSQPERLNGRMVKSLDPMDFACAPQISPSVATLEVAFGDNVTLTCQVTGDPDPRVSWYHNGQKITATSSSTAVLANETEAEASFYYTFANSADGLEGQRSVLNIINATHKENGSYVCTAENRAGSARTNFTLLIQPVPTSPPPPASIEYVITVGGVVAAIVITMVIIVVAVAVRCCCCRRRSHRTRDKTANNLASIGGDSTKTKVNTSSLSPELPPRPIQMLPSSSTMGKGNNGYVVGVPLTSGPGGGHEYHSTTLDSTLDQSPDLINDTTATKWKEQNTQAVCLVDGPYSSSAMYAIGGGAMGSVSGSRLDCSVPSTGQYYPCTTPLSTISEAVLQQQQQHYYPSHCSTNPYNTVSSNMAVLNPSSYLPMPGLPLVDADGFPIDYGLPRPSRPTRPTQTHVRFADPPSVSVRHYENYVLDGDNHLQEATENFLPDRKYPESYDPLPSGPANSVAHSEIRYPSERYPQEFSSSYPVAYNGTGNYEEIIATPPTAYGNQQQQQQQEFMYPAPGQMIKPNSSTSIESSENSTVTLTGGAPSSPFDVSINDASSSSPGFLCSSTLQRQPHESPDEGYEDEGIDGTEI